MTAMAETGERPFAELPASLVDEMLNRTEDLGAELLLSFQKMRAERAVRRKQLEDSSLVRREGDLPFVPIPTTCGVDGSYAIERLLSTDLVAAAAVAVEGLTPPSETRYWPEPRHLTYIGIERHDADTGTILRAVMIGMELKLASEAPHDVVFIDGSLTTPIIYFNQAMNKVMEGSTSRLRDVLLGEMVEYLEAYHMVLASMRSDRCWVGVPKYTTRREIGRALNWPPEHEDRGLLTATLQSGEFTSPIPIERPRQQWHLSTWLLSEPHRSDAERLVGEIVQLLDQIRVLYYRPHGSLPALRLEVARALAETPGRLASLIMAVRHQTGVAGILEPFPLYLADRIVKQMPRAMPTFRQVTSQRLAETYQGEISDVFLGLHGYRTESGH